MIAIARQTLAGTLALMIFLVLALDAILFVLNRTVPDQYHENVPEHWLAYASFTIGIVGSIVGTGLGFLLAQRRHKNPIGWLFLVGTLLLNTASIAEALRTYRANVGEGVSVFGLFELPELEVLDFFSMPAAILGLAAVFIFLLVLFPEGRFGSIPGQVIGAIVIGLTSLTLIEFVFGPSVAGRENPVAIPWLYELVAYRLAVLDQELSLSLLAFYLTIPLAGIFFVIRYLRSEGERRLQMKWLGVAGLIGALGVIAALVSFYTKGFFEVYFLDFRWSEWTRLLYGIGFNLVPIAAAVAIFKYRLYDIDLILKGSIVFGSLAAFISGGYIVAVVGIGYVLGGERDFVSSIAATSLVAMAFQPVRSASARVANRLVFGRKAAPYEALIRMTEQMRAAQPMERILPSLAETVAGAIGARGVRIHLMLSSGEKLQGDFVGSDGVPASDGVFPILRGDSAIGQLEVMKRRGESISEGDKSVVRALMPRIALALENMRLALELRDRLEQKQAQAAVLQESLRRVTNATLRTRLAFQREVYGAVASSLSEIEKLLPETGASSADALGELIDIASAKTHDALEKVREIARGIFPPLLADKGLAAAIEAEISEYQGLEVEIDESLLISRPNAEIESSIYFCCREAIRRLAGSSDVILRILNGGGHIEFEISSKGNPQLLPHGAVMDMQDRIDALGGSLTIVKSDGELQLKGIVPR